MIEIADIASMTSIARALGVNQSVVANWRKRYPDFPQPFVRLSENTSLFSMREVKEWAAAHLETRTITRHHR